MSKLVSLQVLRALAALSVAMLHAQHDAAALAERIGRSFAPVTAFPWEAGVDVFFVISGFIMVYTSAPLFGAPDGRRLFLARRIARIVPIYWAVTTVFLLVALGAPSLLNSQWPGLGRILASYLFIPVARPDGLVQPVYGLGWTLNYEMFFYILFAFAIAWPRQQAVPGLMLALMVLVAAGRLFGPLSQPLRFWSDPIILEFVYGMGLGLLHAGQIRLSTPVRAVLAGVAVAALIAVATLPNGSIMPDRALAYGLPAAMLVAAVAFRREIQSQPSRIAALGAALGDASYALYLIHPFAIRTGREIVWLSGLGQVTGPWGMVLVSLLASLLVALAVHRWFERPVTGHLRRYLAEAKPRIAEEN